VNLHFLTLMPNCTSNQIFQTLKNHKMKMARNNRFAFCFLILTLIVVLKADLYAQTNFLNGPDAYLGQKPQGDTPQIFAKGMLADSGIVLGKVAFSKDGRCFYYSFARHWFDDNGSGTKEIRFDGMKWLKPLLIAEKITNPAFSPDETKLYLGAGGGQVWVLNKTNKGWSKPEFWLENNYGLYNFQEANSGTFYLGSNGTKGSKRDWSTYDFCKLNISGKDTIISSLGNVINTSAFDGDFFIAPYESYIIISAKETPTYDSELWISFRKKDNTWSVPQSLGSKINNGLAHRFGQYVSPDGKYLFYTRGTGEADCNIYWVRFDTILKKLKANIK
jgi:WD40-like Beta Propeller Repeat